ncbi:hypothetical protein PCANC_22419 [Puccinia coronata f. sp. avenae]|uniref:Uncharacterized protein n=1 Tax=Puccinia coronata f. sp. avenae TaxID=200324 RepID=A0A2N5SFR0_9BASI|nr:hypothetical protein PCANC_21947 [Puccinia coronata f. sp. avenae]PLW29138.1 hypothetical protein PCANC_22419 [Puccinia coronata f. sp. avenae]
MLLVRRTCAFGRPAGAAQPSRLCRQDHRATDSATSRCAPVTCHDLGHMCRLGCGSL